MVNEYLMMVVANAIVLVRASDDTAAYDDLVNSLLLAQLVANKQIEKSPGGSWYDAYVSVLDGFWLRHEKARQTWAFNSAEKLAPDVFGAMLTEGALGDARTTAAVLARMATLPGEERAIELLHKHMQTSVECKTSTVSASLTNVRLLVVLADTPTSLTSAYVEFATRQELASNPFQQSYRPDDLVGPVHVHHAKANLSEILYGPAREAIAMKVRDRLADNVVTLALPKQVESRLS